MIPAIILTPETVNVVAVDAFGKVALRAEGVPDLVIAGPLVRETVLEAMALVCCAAPGLFKVIVPL